MSPKVIVKMHREGKDSSSSEENGLFQPVLRPTWILACCQNLHEDHGEKLVTHAAASPHIIKWGGKPGEKSERQD